MNKKHTKILAILAVSILLTSGAGLIYAQDTTAETGSAVAAATADTIEPSDVENFKAQAGDSEVLLTWDKATDNVAVTGYKIYRGTQSVKSTDADYDLPSIPVVGDINNYIVKNLTNGQKYYFTITAKDAAGLESGNYAIEVSATPEAGATVSQVTDDGSPPQVKEIKAEDVITVQAIFSEAVKLPLEQPASAFKIEKISDKSRLIVQKAEIDARDATGKTILLTVEPQTENEDYLVTAGIELQDMSGNPVVSGTSDTGMFKGSAKLRASSVEGTVEQPPVEDKEAPLVTGAVSEGGSVFNVTFSEAIVLPDDAKTKFIITNKSSSARLAVVNVTLSVDSKVAYVATSKQDVAEYEIKVSGVKDTAGNVITENSTVSATGTQASLKDLVPPEDVTKLVSRIKDAQNNIVELKWTASKNTAKDLADQVVYQSEGRGTKVFSAGGKSLGGVAVTYDVSGLEVGKWHSFKVTTKDTSGNESKGAFTSIFLPQTGPGILAAGLTAVLVGLYRRRKNRK